MKMRWSYADYSTDKVSSKYCLTINICLGLVIFGHAQSPKYNIVHIRNIRKNLYVNYIPFGAVKVLDNRFDTTQVYLWENGTYPPERIDFDTTASVAIRRYIDDAIHRVRHGSDTLLINIEQMTISNKRRIARMGRPDRRHIFGIKKGDYVVNYDLRDRLLFATHVYYKRPDGRYRELVSIHLEYLYGTFGFIGQSIADLLNETVEVASLIYANANGLTIKSSNWLKRRMSDTAYFTFYKGENDVSLSVIDRNVQENWKKYPILDAVNSPSGRFRTFDDFRNNRLIPGMINLNFDNKDSVCKRMELDKDSSGDTKDWAVCDSGCYYMRLFGNAYLRLERHDNGYYFYVPWSLPDMYALLSLEELAFVRGTNNSNSNNIQTVLTAMALAATTGRIVGRARMKEIAAAGLKHGFRHCPIDMDSGDILISKDWASWQK
jgi:hypothetical protein